MQTLASHVLLNECSFFYYASTTPYWYINYIGVILVFVGLPWVIASVARSLLCNIKSNLDCYDVALFEEKFLCSSCIQEYIWIVDDLYLFMLGYLCAWAESTWPAVGVANRHDQWNAQFVVLVGHIQTYRSPFLTSFDGFVVLTDRPHTYTSGSGEICAHNWQMDKPITLPLLVHVGLIYT